MPNTPDKETPLLIQIALRELEERESEREKLEEGYQKLDSYIDEIIDLACLVEVNPKKNIKYSSNSFEGALFRGFELTGILPNYEKMQANIKLSRMVSADLDKTPARVMVSMDLYPAGQIEPNEDQLLGSLDYALGYNLLISHNKSHNKADKMSVPTITPGDATFDWHLRNIQVVIDTAKEMLQGLSL